MFVISTSGRDLEVLVYKISPAGRDDTFAGGCILVLMGCFTWT